MNPIKRIYTPAKKQTILIGRDATPTITSNVSASGAPEFSEKLDATLPIGAPETLAKLRAAYLVFAKTEQEDLRRAELCAMHRHVRSLTASAGLLGFHKIAQMANAFEALLVELYAKPKKITPSVIRTVANAIDTLAFLFDQVANPRGEVLVRPKILVLDDEIISREMICSALGKVNANVVSLDDSIAAQRLLEQDHFDLIFLDVEMPGQSGLELCVNIREMATNCATPVIFVTFRPILGAGRSRLLAVETISSRNRSSRLNWRLKR
jgi:hypothetical protein